MYRQNRFWVGLCSVAGFIIAVHSFLMDTISTTQNLIVFMDWAKNSNLDKSINQLFIRVQTLIELQGFWLVFLPIAFLIWRNHARN